MAWLRSPISADHDELSRDTCARNEYAALMYFPMAANVRLASATSPQAPTTVRVQGLCGDGQSQGMVRCLAAVST